MRRALPFLMLLLLAGARPAAAQQMPVCGAGWAGAVACMSGKLCLCRFERGGSLTGVQDGYRWDCGVMRPACGEALPGAGAPPAMPLPDLYLQLPPPAQQRSPWMR
ncbi:hypothetical protein [Falsiroseomonas sp. CW058]|uniref:hypothetical protein n=1 Tax=Falsiroseomonas sp. CW058 TaxID=3388664 RepID=UPI003D314702